MRIGSKFVEGRSRSPPWPPVGFVYFFFPTPGEQLNPTTWLCKWPENKHVPVKRDPFFLEISASSLINFQGIGGYSLVFKGKLPSRPFQSQIQSNLLAIRCQDFRISINTCSGCRNHRCCWGWQSRRNAQCRYCCTDLRENHSNQKYENKGHRQTFPGQRAVASVSVQSKRSQEGIKNHGTCYDCVHKTKYHSESSHFWIESHLQDAFELSLDRNGQQEKGHYNSFFFVHWCSCKPSRLWEKCRPIQLEVPCAELWQQEAELRAFAATSQHLHPRKFTLKISNIKRKLIFQPSSFRGKLAASFQGSIDCSKMTNLRKSLERCWHSWRSHWNSWTNEILHKWLLQIYTWNLMTICWNKWLALNWMMMIPIFYIGNSWNSPNIHHPSI